MTEATHRRKSAIQRYMTSKVAGGVSLSLICAVWGSTFVLNKDALRFVGVFFFLALRFLLATVLLFGYASLVRWNQLKLAIKEPLVYLAGIALFLGYCLQSLGLRVIEPATSGFITGLSVAIVPIAAVVLGARVKPLHIVAALIGVAGLYLLSYPLSSANLGGEFVTLMCAVAFALQIVLTEKLPRELDPISVVAVEVAIVTVFSVIVSFTPLETAPLGRSLVGFDQGEVLLAIFIGGAIATALALVTQTHFQRYMPSTEVAIVYNLEPLFALLFSVLIDHLNPSYFALVGGVLVLASMTTSALA
ncbi:EamA-like transporter family protein [Ferrithrix thermotolerans DSM 19514]|uniref:EamA-like transporter family protein n=1 Tax=Ferrithrix thermotolerans DSM 19514 TaxID=1121881 RepID=A0A1M4UFM5_9ACTN|nr:DMT family transporter [Ferrithrix thermotolerans]SHE55398.1 EamA-like transporter family protein [Ferrithrix thermotolerans DSM 19514]